MISGPKVAQYTQTQVTEGNTLALALVTVTMFDFERKIISLSKRNDDFVTDFH